MKQRFGSYEDSKSWPIPTAADLSTNPRIDIAESTGYITGWRLTIDGLYQGHFDTREHAQACAEHILAEKETYKIVRFFREDRPNEVIRTGLTLQEAQEHCSAPYTQGQGWFDGYHKETR
jgi:hypothetical protein